MRFFLNENFPRTARDHLVAAGHDCTRALDHFSPGATDEELFTRTQELGAIFVTTDRDFFHTIPWLHECHAGVIAIALAQPNRDALLARLNDALQLWPEGVGTPRVWLLTDDRLFER